MTNVASLSAIIASRSVLTTAKKDGVKETQSATNDGVISSQFSSAVRSLILAGIKVNKADGAGSASAAKKAENVNYIEGINATVVKETTAEETNAWWHEEMNYDKDPYLAGSKVQHVRLEEDTKFVRVYDGKNSGMKGGWMMKASDIEGLTPEQIREKFALPNTPLFICDVTVPAGTVVRTGVCGPIEGWGKGGGVQFDMMGQRVGEFENERPLAA